jgi:uncharacterized protein (DUF1778 family)
MFNKEIKMYSRHDLTAAIKEPSDERMHFRVKKRVKQTIRQAAALTGMDDSSFVISAAYDAAIKAIETHQKTVLQEIDFEPFFTALDNPPAPTDALKKAFERRKDIIG